MKATFYAFEEIDAREKLLLVGLPELQVSWFAGYGDFWKDPLYFPIDSPFKTLLPHRLIQKPT